MTKVLHSALKRPFVEHIKSRQAFAHFSQATISNTFTKNGFIRTAALGHDRSKVPPLGSVNISSFLSD